MLHSKDLRVGNLIIWNPKLSNPGSTLPPMYIEVFEIMQDKIAYVFPNIENRVEPFEDEVVQMGSRTKELKELEPIELTADILIHAGFKEKTELLGSKYFLKNDFELKPEEQSFIIDFKAFDVSVKYLHQLQNLYYSTSGEELDIDHFW